MNETSTQTEFRLEWLDSLVSEGLELWPDTTTELSAITFKSSQSVTVAPVTVVVRAKTKEEAAVWLYVKAKNCVEGRSLMFWRSRPKVVYIAEEDVWVGCCRIGSW